MPLFIFFLLIPQVVSAQTNPCFQFSIRLNPESSKYENEEKTKIFDGFSSYEECKRKSSFLNKHPSGVEKLESKERQWRITNVGACEKCNDNPNGDNSLTEELPKNEVISETPKKTNSSIVAISKPDNENQRKENQKQSKLDIANKAPLHKNEPKRIEKQDVISIEAENTLQLAQQLEDAKEGDEWEREVLKNYLKVVELYPYHELARWKAANYFEFLGVYSEAMKHFQKLTEYKNTYQRDAKAHLITCQLLFDLSGDKTTLNFEDIAEVEKLDVSEDAINERNNFEELKAVAAAVAIEGDLVDEKKKIKIEGRYISLAINHLLDWLNAPKEGKIEARNKLLVGMVSSLASIILEKEISGVIEGIDLNKIKSTIEDLPETEIGGIEQHNFENRTPIESREFEINGVKSIIQVDKLINLNGIWNSISTNGKCTSGGAANNKSKARIKMEGNEIELVFEMDKKQTKFRGIMTGDEIILEGTNSSKTGNVEGRGKSIFNLQIESEKKITGFQELTHKMLTNGIVGHTSYCTWTIIFTR